ncbi:hypothetical protein CES85_3042 (plasmid) [Ochrobactrum quorumnocens]|uniref:Uncharacterized protein n=1 Tax=Ochrobactrum quorumnocens TaxID=271865 RepID=A0A248UNS8_9HYPH|nr:hypothetical protein [[Ochrobactrum] quorumnocens]ASV87969.1 hypothetical protein CES85_3042 [[Ochrobactrum] quorumnocens]
MIRVFTPWDLVNIMTSASASATLKTEALPVIYGRRKCGLGPKRKNQQTAQMVHNKD